VLFGIFHLAFLSPFSFVGFEVVWRVMLAFFQLLALRVGSCFWLCLGVWLV
jgi:hypothetical protein